MSAIEKLIANVRRANQLIGQEKVPMAWRDIDKAAAELAALLQQRNEFEKSYELALTGKRRAEEALAAARDVLKIVEWHHETIIGLSGERIEVNMCPICDQTPIGGHAPDCTLAAALDISLAALVTPPTGGAKLKEE